MYGNNRRPPLWSGWFGGPATRRFETSQRDAKTDVWMVWLQALSSVAILLVDMGLLVGWLYLVPHWVIYVVVSILIIFGPAVLVLISVPIVGIAITRYAAICRIQAPRWNWQRIIIIAVGIASGMGAIAVPLVALLAGDWCHDIVAGEFPGKALPFWIYLCYAGLNIAFIIGTATAFIRWWAREVPDPMLPEIRQMTMEPPETTKMWLPTWGKDSRDEIHKRQGETTREIPR